MRPPTPGTTDAPTPPRGSDRDGPRGVAPRPRWWFEKAGGVYPGRLQIDGHERLILRSDWGARAKFVAKVAEGYEEGKGVFETYGEAVQGFDMMEKMALQEQQDKAQRYNVT